MDLREAAELVRQCVLNTTTGREVYPGQRCVQPGMVTLSVARKMHEALHVVDLALAPALLADDAANDDDYEATRIDRMRAALAGSGVKLVTTPEEAAAAAEGGGGCDPALLYDARSGDGGGSTDG